MSTKSHIASGASWCIEEEMINDSTRLVIDGPTMDIYAAPPPMLTQIALTLSPEILDMIVAIHNRRGFPHQRPRSNKIDSCPGLAGPGTAACD